MAIPAKLQNEIKQFQRLQQELAMLDQQRMQLEMKLRETLSTLEELKSVPDDAPIYRPVGGLLVKATGKKEVEDGLTEEKETLEVRVKGHERNLNHLRERLQTMQKELTSSLQAAGVAVDSGGEEAS
ncbi:MAG: prefoldin subunit beta [Euryarchaeota archaeon]|nr:prefoldin subunit beta [Euryarchaeota archaeon]MDE1836312.1 prefoldin subunit beta [Euryarchaeota archaeon]MDE1879110.1 prefoldin subunit beta [Euryarchaeota archaeon]MDE2044292.1 prefoldin subunit beta [Thermoplasmata archaeon]